MKRAYLLALLLCFVGCQKAASQNDVGEPASIELEPLPQPNYADEIYPTLIGGTPADPKDFPASVYASMSGARCTATVVAPRVLLIAAHCVGNGGTASFKLVTGKSYTSRCEHHPDYNRDSTADFALCLVSEPVTDTLFETLNTDPSVPKVGDRVQMTGYGCTQPGGTGGNDGTYRVGFTNVISMHQGNQDIVTRGNGVAACYGDSGGPTFFYSDEANKIRVQIAVTSRGNIRDTSYLVSLTGGKFLPWLKSVAAKWSQPVCGLDGFMTGCRGEKKAPPGPQLPEHCLASFKLFDECLFGTPRKAQKEAALCQKTYAELFACEEAAELTE